MSVRLVQLLCPQRHCIVAVYYDDTTTTAEVAKAVIHKGAESLGINPWCGICHAPEATFFHEDRPTTFATMEEAHRPMKLIEAANIATGLTHGELGGPKHSTN